MTTVSEGYPDWQRTSTRAFDPFYRQTVDTLGVTVSTGLLFVGNFPTLMLLMTASGTSKYNITVQWYTDSNKSTALLVEQIGLDAAAGSYRVGHAVLSPWVDIFIVPVTYAAGDTVNLSITPTTNATPGIQLTYPLIFEENAHSVAGGATDTVYGAAILPGPAVMYWRALPTVWSINLQVMDNLGAYHSRYYVDSVKNVASDFKEIVLPPRPVRVALMNSDAGAGLFNFTIGSKVF